MTQYYADPAGSDGNDGLSTGTAWASIDHALGQMSGGDTLDLADGTYSEDSGAGYLNPGGYAFGSEVVIRATNPGLAIIESASNAVQTIFATSAAGATSNLTFEDLVIRHRTTGMRWLTRWDAPATNIRFRRVAFEINDTIHGSGGVAVYNFGGTMTGLVLEDCTLDISNGQFFGLIQSTGGSNVIDGLTVTGLSVTGDASIFKLINIDDLRGTCIIAGSIEADGDASDTSHLVYIGNAGAACSLGFGDGLTLIAGNCRGISIMEAGTAANMTLTGGDVTGTCARRVFGAEFGVTGAVGTITATMTGTDQNNPVELRSDSTDNGTLSVKDFTVDLIDLSTAAAYHCLLFGRHSENIEVKALMTYDGPQNIPFVDKGDGNRIGTVTPAVLHGGTVGAMYLKGARNGVYDNTTIYQGNGGAAISMVLDDVESNKVSGCSIQGCCVFVTSGTLFENAGASVDDGGNVVDGNTYLVDVGESWGEVYGTAVSDLVTLMAAWDAYDQDANDETSIARGVLVYDDAEAGDLIAHEELPVSPATAWAADLDGLLTEGVYTLGVLIVNEYGCASERETIEVVIGSGGEVDQGMINPTNVYAEVLAAGMVALVWDAIEDLSSDTNQIEPAEFEIAESGDLSTILATTAYRTIRLHRDEVGPFSDGATVTLAVRASDGEESGVRGDWVYADAVVADAVGPATPDIDENALPDGCGCG